VFHDLFENPSLGDLSKTSCLINFDRIPPK
jgi:hypothetical protein